MEIILPYTIRIHTFNIQVTCIFIKQNESSHLSKFISYNRNDVSETFVS